MAKSTTSTSKRRARKTDEEVRNALIACKGFVAPAAKMLGLDRSGLCKRIDKSELLAKTVQECRDTSLDVAEAKLFEAIEDREAWAVCFFLKTQGVKRGYSEKQHIQMDANVAHFGGVCVYLPHNGRDDRPDVEDPPA